MSKVAGSSRIEELRRALTRADHAAFLVEPRVIRRVIRERFGFAQLSASIPHVESQIVPLEDVESLVHPDELGLETFSDLPAVCLLICQPDEDEMQHWPMQELLLQVWRRLFHAQIDRELVQRLSTSLDRANVQERIAGIGQVEFDEAHFVLRSEIRLVDPESRIEAWRELVASYLEMKYFAPDLLAVWFPSIAGRTEIDEVLVRDVSAEEILNRTQLYGATKPDLTPHAVRDEMRLVNTRRDWSMGIGIIPSDRAYVKQLRRRDRTNERGNTVAAIVSAIRAMQRATSEEKRSAAQEKARADVRYLVERLRRAIEFPDEDTEAWQASLWELATNSVHGFWNSEKRLLYDLQKVCLDHERVTYKVDLVKWVVSRGRRPLRRPLNSLREVMMAKHLASSTAKLVYVRLSGVERDRLTGLLQRAASLAKEQMRQRMRPVLQQTLHDVHLEPTSIPEQVAFDKLTEDSLDCIADRGYLTMGYLRDAISKNDLKLPDLKQLHELWRGDHLLRADDRLDVAMDGVYRRGEFYLRSLQITSSMFFGTPVGRFTTLFLAIPFGGALVIVEGVRHVIHIFRRAPATSGSGSQNTIANTPEFAPAGSLVDRAAKGVGYAEIPQDVVSRLSNDSAQPAESSATPLAESSTLVTNSASTASLSSATGTIDDNVPTAGTREVVQMTSNSDDAMDQIVSRQVETISWVLIIGLLLMVLIHVSEFRRHFFQLVRLGWRLLKAVAIDLPLKLLRLPFIQKIWRDRAVVKFRRYVLTPSIVSIVGAKFLLWLLTGRSISWWWVGTCAVLFSLALNSRLGQDAQELTAEWVGNAWYKLRARVVMAVIDWIIDLFRVVLNFVERILYAVDEWLRFHSDESWLSIVTKAVLGVIWSFLSFLIRIYINLLIEPTLHPVKHFPVVTVAHKIFFPFIEQISVWMFKLFEPYMGKWLAGVVTGFNIFFLPGIFGFVVWELKENWRLYQANRQPQLTPVPVGSHGETVARLLRPGFHSGTLPKMFRRLRRLEHQDASFKRFSSRRAGREQLEHVETAIRSFVERDLIRLLELCSVWKGTGLTCGHIHAASNSFCVELQCSNLGATPVGLLFQEQSGWVVASIAETGWLRFASADQIRSFQNAVEGFYRKAGIDLVREQVEETFIHQHPYDINADGFAIWPNGQFNREVLVDLNRKGPIRPVPAAEASAAGIGSAERDAVVFSESRTLWNDWEMLWSAPANMANPQALPPACSHRSAKPVLPPIR